MSIGINEFSWAEFAFLLPVSFEGAIFGNSWKYDFYLENQRLEFIEWKAEWKPERKSERIMLSIS